MKMRIKYFEGATKLVQITKGNWIDVYSREDVFIELGEYKAVKLGFALELPKGYEAHIAPRGSTFKTWGVIETNSVGVVDDTYIGDNDEWKMPLYCLEPKEHKNANDVCNPIGVWIRKGDKIGQFRIMEIMPKIDFEEVDYFGNEARSGFGSTGRR